MHSAKYLKADLDDGPVALPNPSSDSCHSQHGQNSQNVQHENNAVNDHGRAISGTSNHVSHVMENLDNVIHKILAHLPMKSLNTACR